MRGASKNISAETITIVEILETLPSVKRRYLTDKLRELVNEEIAEQKWEETFANPKAMIKMAERALKEHKKGKSELMNL